MEYYDQEYLKLFKQVKENQLLETKDYTFDQLKSNVNSINQPMLKETPNYDSFKNFKQNNINEVQRNNYSQDLNLNEFNIETKVNGQNINEVKREEKENKLNEVMEHLRQERLDAMKKEQEDKSLNESVNFKDVSVVTVEMFEKARYNSMMQVAKRILPK